jgi:hypothetical protein
MPFPNVYFDKLWWTTCRVKILIVTDDQFSGGFGDTASFHVGQIIRILGEDPWSHVSFVVTKAHRQDGSGVGADHSNFRFHTHDLSQYSQIWLFGITRLVDALSPPELKALAQFMDGGGGVFATGDHENLGQAMCAEVPRVRSMRRWYHPSAGPNGEPIAPDQSGDLRHDTVMNDAIGGNQSDKEPQPIRPKIYTRRTGGRIIYRVHQFPHPVLCGPNGRIEYLPDHMHEGLCEVPDDLNKSWTFDGYTSAEYPVVAGHQESPEVIAWATTRNTSGEEFGVLGAYDGHRASVGRVVVDATWHHWFNINLTGFLAATDPALPGYDPTVVPKWEAIKAYYRNVGLWLARPGLQRCLRNGGWIIILKYADILMTQRPLDQVRDRLTYYWQLGVFARDAMGRLASQCQTTQWVIDTIPWLDFQLTPWPPIRKPPLPDPPPWLDVSELENVVLGGAVHELLAKFRNEKSAQEILEKRSDEVEALVRQGAKAGVAELLKRYTAAGQDATKLDQLLKKVP